MKQKLMKILVLTSLSALALAACSQNQNFKIFANYNGQADLLLSLQAPPDYYPFQYQENSFRNYISEPSKYVITNNHTSSTKKMLQEKIDARFKELLSNVKATGPSLWNNAIYDSGAVSRNLEFWNSKNADLAFVERFVLDDHKTITDARSYLPTYKNLIQTNFRASRDPYTTFGPNVYKYSEQTPNSAESENSDAKIAIGLNKYVLNYPQRDEPDALYRYNSYIRFWDEHINKNNAKLKQSGYYNWIKNYDIKKQNLTKNKTAANVSANLSISGYSPIFYPGNSDFDQKLSKLYQKVILDTNDVNKIESFSNKKPWELHYESLFKNHNHILNIAKNIKKTKMASYVFIKNNSKNNLIKQKKHLFHHPAFEQQTTPGSSPAAEGSQRDAMVYLFQLASGIDDYVKTPNFKQDFKNDFRYEYLKHALENVSLISSNLKTRLTNIRKYLQEINVVDKNYDPDNNKFNNSNSKIVSIVTYPPSSGGAGNATIQTISKFAFIYSDIGLKQVLPVKINNQENNTNKDNNTNSNLMDLDFNNSNGVKYAGQNKNLTKDQQGSELFNIDDNGWWWNLGDGTKETTNLQHFNKTSNTVIIAATPFDWSNLTGQASNASTPFVKSLASISKTYDNNDSINKINTNKYSVHHVQYNLWNEGLRSPFSVNMVLDQLVQILQKQYDSNFSLNKNQLYQHAMDWGNYWSDNFINKKFQTTFVTK